MKLEEKTSISIWQCVALVTMLFNMKINIKTIHKFKGCEKDAFRKYQTTYIKVCKHPLQDA